MEQFAANVFVGREQEMAVLRAGLKSAMSGRGQLVLLVGEPGIGKTRTAHELALYAGQQEAQVFFGRCYEGEGAPPFWPWVQIVRALVTKRAPHLLQVEMGVGAADIAQVIPEVREQLPDVPLAPPREPEQARFCFFDSLTTWFKNAGQRQPLVLILDDLQDADKSSLLLLQFVARELENAHLLLVGTYRDIALERQHPLVQVVGELLREPVTQRLFLQGLTARDVARFIDLTVGSPMPQELSAAIYNKTQGNPFFVTEMVRLLVAQGGQSGIGALQSDMALPLPQGVREAIGRRLNTLSADCYRVLTSACVLGREYSLDTLASVSNTTSEQLLATLEEAVAARIITEIPGSVGDYSFIHPLVRETLYADLSASQRVWLHRRAAEVLEERYRTNVALYPAAHSGLTVSELAYHFFEATRTGGAVDKAVDYAIKAGRHATILLAYEEAVHHYERALQLLELQKADDLQRCELLLLLGEAQRRASNTTHAKDTLRHAADLARKLGAPESLARAALGFAIGFAGVSATGGAADPLVISLLEEALQALPQEDSTLRAKVLGRLAMELYWSTSKEQRAVLSQQAVDVARRVGDLATLGEVLHAKLVALRGPESVEDRLTTGAEIMQIAEAIADKELALRGHIWCITALLELGDLIAVDREIAAFTQRAEALRQASYLWVAATWKAMRAGMDGRLAEAEQFARQAFAIGQRAHDPDAAQCFIVQMFAFRGAKQNLEEIAQSIKHFAEQYPAVLSWRAGLALMYAVMDREAEARREFEYFATHNFANIPRYADWIVAIANLSVVCVKLREIRHAATLYQLLCPFAHYYVVIGIGIVNLGAVERFLGLLAMLLGRWEAAVAHFEAALQCHAQIGARTLTAYTQHEYALMLLVRKQPGDFEKASALLEHALVTAQACEMDQLMQAVLAIKAKLQPQMTGTSVPAETPTTAEPARAGQGAGERAERAAENVFRLDGAYWTLTYHGTTCRLKDAKGLHYIACLLRHPGRAFLTVELFARMHPEQPLPPVIITRAAGGNVVPSRSTKGGSNAGTLLDAQEQTAYKRRLDELQHELEEARRFHNAEGAAKAQAEIECLTDAFAAALGRSGRGRQTSPAAARARSTVTKSIKAAIKKIQAHHAALGYHLALSIKTGTLCRYVPDPIQPLVWTL